MRSQKGFTIIELVMVIVILAILGGIAVPKYVDLRRDSVLATMEHLTGVLKSAATITYSKALIQGLESNASTTININGQNVAIIYGYPSGTAAGIGQVIDLDADDWNNNIRDGAWHSRASTFPGAWIYWHGTYTENAGSLQCYLRYRQPTAAGLRPVVNFVSNEC